MIDVELRHHYGWKRYSMPADNIHEAAKQAVRHTHGFLTDTNHTMEAGDRAVTWGGKELAFKSVRVFRDGDAPAYSGPPSLRTDYWFAVEYREPLIAAAAKPSGEGQA